MSVIKQVILNLEGDSWLGFYTTDHRFVKRLRELRELSFNEKYRDYYWLLTLDGEIVVEGDIRTAMNIEETRLIIVHNQKYFI